jgi:secernin
LLEPLAHDNGWWKPADGRIDFAYACGDHEHYARQVSHIRWRRAGQLLERAYGRIGIDTMSSILRDHYESTFIHGPFFNEYLPDFLTLCMHDSPAGFTWGDTATSIVIEIGDDPAMTPVWCAYLPPCSSVYSAYFLGASLPDMVTTPGRAGLRSEAPARAPADRFDASSLWWRMYRIVKAVAASPGERKPRLRSLFDAIEHGNRKGVESLLMMNASADTAMLEEYMTQRHEKLIEAVTFMEDLWNISDPV